MDAVAAKNFLISKVVQEGELSQQPLSAVEKQMLYFTEAQPSLPDIMEVNAEFERDYDSDDYEKKIVRLLKSARARDSHLSRDREQEWKDAINALQKEDHYILVMVGMAFGYGSSSNNGHRVRDSLIYVFIGICIFVALIWWAAKH